MSDEGFFWCLRLHVDRADIWRGGEKLSNLPPLSVIAGTEGEADAEARRCRSDGDSGPFVRRCPKPRHWGTLAPSSTNVSLEEVQCVLLLSG